MGVKLLAEMLMALGVASRRVVIRSVWCGVLATGMWCSSLAAETVELQGEQLQIDAFAAIDEKTVRITVAGRERVVSLDEAGVAALEILIEAGAELPIETLKRLLSGALGRHHPAPRVARASLIGISKAPDSRSADWRPLIEELAQTERGRAFFRACLSSPCASALLPEQRAALFFVSIAGSTSWIREVRPEYLYPHQAVLLSHAQERWESLIAAERLDDAAALVAALGIAFPWEEPVRSLRLLNRRLDEPLRAIGERLNAGEIESACDQIDRLRMALDAEAALRVRLSGLLVNLVHRAAHRARLAGDAGALMSCISRLDFETRTGETLTLLRSALELEVGAATDREWHGEVAASLLKYSHIDPEIARLIGSWYEVRVRRALKSAAFQQAGVLFEALLQHRPDPSALNDKLRASFASSLSWHRRYATARSVLAGVKTTLGLKEQTMLLLCGYYFEPVLLVVMIGLLLALGAARLPPRAPAAVFKEPERPQTRGEGEAPDSTQEYAARNPGFSMLRSTTQHADEYIRLLSSFSLGSDASRDQIKHAYRQMIKKVHPDVDPGGAEKERFLEITKHYNRLLELRRDRGFD